MLKKRVITALWGIPLVVIAIWFNEPLPWFTLLAAVCGILAIQEFYRITAVYRTLSLLVFGSIWTLLLIIQPHWGHDGAIPVLLASAMVISLILRVPTSSARFSMTVWVWSTTGIIYVGLLLGLLVSLRLEAGKDWLYLVIFGTFGSDTFAYFIGRAIGRHKLAPRISPGKTWEGAVGGLFGSVIVSLLFTLPTPVQIAFGYREAILLGLLISVSGQIGDLAESMLKRHKGIKESGRLMPGHGGLLDRLDSVLLAGLAIYLYYIFAVA